MAAGSQTTAIVLCPGRSLPAGLQRLREAVPAGKRPPIVIGVARAVEAWSCDYWSLLDARTFRQIAPVGTPTIVTREQAAAELGSALAGREVILREDLPAPPRSTRWDWYSATVAVVLAWSLGARRIEVYGADLVGETDWDGKRLAGQNRSCERWAREAQAWALMTAWLACERVVVQRCRRQPNDNPT